MQTTSSQKRKRSENSTYSYNKQSSENDISAVCRKVESLLIEQNQLRREIRTLRGKNKRSEQKILLYQKSIEIINHVAESTQKKLQVGITNLLNMAMQSIFEKDCPAVQIEFVKRRGKTECDIFLLQNDSKLNPLDGHGGGLIDVLAFALQICLWKIKRPQSRNTLILDEPLKYLKGKDLPKKGAKLIKELAHRLNIQIIMVSHSTELIEEADKLFQVIKNKQTTIVKEISHV